ncbi:NACHT domain-containing protein [Devosia lacusdianchii]|uniref:NACHT domain-containing protein n=1 Tax=Devosia lacusdianchii TaxID=2917991 RepID=UPI001F0665DD|nr:NACHT domain-containing protein [Devosia sp. JXJ CY 41]
MTDQATEAAFAATAAQMAKEYVDSTLSQVSRMVKNQILPHLVDFREYMSVTYRKCNSIKLIVDRDQVHRLDAIYVKGKYTNGGQAYDDDDLADMVRQSGRVVVQGFGGIGKTVLLKYIWLCIFKSSEGKIPLFIELRRLNELKAVDLLSFIRASLAPSGQPMSEEQFSTLLRAGRFIFLFDALDELNDELKTEIEKQILGLSYTYGDCGFLVSSRHDARFQSWEQFVVFQSKAFDRAQIEDVIKKVPFDIKTRNKFLAEIIQKKFERYETFLSTPLLAIMMLITFDQFADIPDKIHIFYRYAFQTLYTLHDAGKESFRRRRKSGLSEDDFTKIFSIFCLATYMRRAISFDRQRLIEEILVASRRAGVTVNAAKYVEEVLESVNLMYEEGIMISFTHRSFQEYFAAFALTNHFANDFGRLAGRIPNARSDSVFSLAYEMNKELVEDAYLVPTYEQFRSTFPDFFNKDCPELTLVGHLGLNYLVFMGHRSNKNSLMSERYSVAPFADFIKRAAAFLPDLRGINVGETQLTTDFEPGFRRLCIKISELAGYDQKVVAPFVTMALDSGRVTVEGNGDTRWQAELGSSLLSMWLEDKAAKKMITEAIGSYRLLSSKVDAAMNAVKMRSSQRGETLDELLD